MDELAGNGIEMRVLVDARDAVRRAERHLTRAVSRAREAGLTSEQVARVLEGDVAEVRNLHRDEPEPRSPTPAGRPLTEEEQVIVQLVLAGRTNQTIADRLYLSKRSLEVRLTQIYAALGVAGKADLRRARRVRTSPVTPPSTPAPPPVPPPGDPALTSGARPDVRVETLRPDERAILDLLLDGHTSRSVTKPVSPCSGPPAQADDPGDSVG